jgi:hypothetical protein
MSPTSKRPMMKLTGVLLATALAGAIPAVSYGGADTVPEYSTVDSALAVCPAGDIVFRVAARILPNVLAFRVWWIDVEITDCAALRLGDISDTPGLSIVEYSGRRFLEQMCSPNGLAEFRIPAGGVATGQSLRVTDSHSGVILATRTKLISPDQNGDLRVDLTDVAIASAKVGTTDPTADFDFDGDVDSADMAILESHLGHVDYTGQPTPVAHSTWGGVKAGRIAAR